MASVRTPSLSRRKKLLFLLVVLAIAFALGEVGVRIYYGAKDRVPPTPDRSLEREWMWVKRHQEAGVTLLPSFHVFDPVVGWRNMPNLREALYRTNAQGMRNARDFELDAKGRKRMLFVGDSYTFGAFATNEDSYVGRIEKALGEDWDVLNLAVNGTGTGQQILVYEHYGRPYRPDIVVLGFFVRDVTRNIASFTDYAKPRFVVAGEGLELTGSPVIAPEALLALYAGGERRIGGGVRSYLVDLARRSLSRLERHSLDASSEGWRVLARLMRRFADGVRAAGAVPVWLVIPARDTVEAEGPSRYEPLEVRSVERAGELGMACLRVAPAFRAHAAKDPDAPLYRPHAAGGHLTPQGNAVLADALLAFLQREGLIVTGD